jgi:LuxR family maltose regulon positive regulatory protein
MSASPTIPLRREPSRSDGAPRLAPGLIARPRLLRRLRAAGDLPLILLVAPAGYGKTTLLAEWGARDPRRFIWLDPKAHDVGAGFDGMEDAVLVVDDAHLATAAVLERAAEIAARLPPGSAVALASRQRLGGPIGRLQAHRLALDIGPAELAFTRLEAAMVIGEAGIHLEASAVDNLCRVTEGWPAMLSLAVLALLSGTPADDFDGGDRIVADYLQSQLLAGLPEELACFLRRTAVLDRLTPALCDAVTAGGGAAGALERLADVLVEPLDRRGSAFECHPIVRQYLRAELVRTEPTLVSVLHRRAAEWHRRGGALDDAIGHAVVAGDTGYAGRLLWSFAPGAASAGRSVLVADRLSAFSAREIAAQPELAMTAAVVHLAEGRRDDAVRWVAAADAAARREARGPARAASIALLRASVAADGMAKMGEDAVRASALMDAAAPWQGLAAVLRGVAVHLSGDRDGASGLLERAVGAGSGGLDVARAIGFAQLALIAGERGDWGRATELAERARDVPTPAVPARATALVACAVAGAHGGDPVAARRDASAALALVEPDGAVPPWLTVQARIWLARAALRHGDGATARPLISSAARLAPAAGAPMLATWVHDAWERADALAAAATRTGPALTNAELRVLRFLSSHLTLREIGERLYVSTNTVKTQALATYRKLGVSCRSDAVGRARAIGLIDA